MLRADAVTEGPYFFVFLRAALPLEEHVLRVVLNKH
jgi:hypothetical protein